MVQPRLSKKDKPRVLLRDSTRSAVQRGVQLGYCRRDIARMMKELDLKMPARKKKKKRQDNSRLCKSRADGGREGGGVDEE